MQGAPSPHQPTQRSDLLSHLVGIMRSRARQDEAIARLSFLLQDNGPNQMKSLCWHDRDHSHSRRDEVFIQSSPTSPLVEWSVKTASRDQTDDRPSVSLLSLLACVIPLISSFLEMEVFTVKMDQFRDIFPFSREVLIHALYNIMFRYIPAESGGHLPSGKLYRKSFHAEPGGLPSTLRQIRRP